MSRTALAILAFLVTATGSFAQVQVYQLYHAGRPDSLGLLTGEANNLTAPSSAELMEYAGITGIPVAANPVELTTVDVVAGNLRFLFNPTRAFDYWPEYLYEYNAVQNSGLCNAESSSALQHEMGTIAIVTSSQEPVSATATDVVHPINAAIVDWVDALQAQYGGIALFPTDYRSQRFPDTSINSDVVTNLHLEDLCSWLARDENTPDQALADHLYFATSRAIPVPNLEIVERVSLDLNPYPFHRQNVQ